MKKSRSYRKFVQRGSVPVVSRDPVMTFFKKWQKMCHEEIKNDQGDIFPFEIKIPGTALSADGMWPVTFEINYGQFEP